MALATYKDLCLDATDPAVLGEFWASALALELHHQDGGDVYLTGPTPQHTIWVNRVPEPKTVKNRMHLDVGVAGRDGLQALIDAGARVVDDESFSWIVMADPEGGELCAFVREGERAVGMPQIYEIGVDTTDSPEASRRIAAWWADLLGAEVADDDGYSYVGRIPGAPFETLDFVPVPEPKTVKNRVHLDVTTDSVEALVAAGARVLRERDDEIAWTVLADPEGNEFCAFTP